MSKNPRSNVVERGSGRKYLLRSGCLFVKQKPHKYRFTSSVQYCSLEMTDYTAGHFWSVCALGLAYHDCRRFLCPAPVINLWSIQTNEYGKNGSVWMTRQIKVNQKMTSCVGLPELVAIAAKQ